MKKLTTITVSIFLIILVSFSFVSCNLPEPFASFFRPKGIEEDISLGYVEIEKPQFIYNEAYTPNSKDFSYNLLPTEDEKELYNKLYENVFFIYPEGKTLEDYKVTYYKTKQIILDDILMSEADTRITIKAFTNDHPEIFWLTQYFGYLRDKNKNYTAVQFYSCFAADNVSAYLLETQKAVNSIFDSLPDNLNEYEREKYVHDYLIQNTEYDKDTASSNNYDNVTPFTVYGTLVEHKAVCEGYARTTELLLNSVGVPCVNVIGVADDEYHMWNCVKLGGDWYNLDTTWDDAGEEYFWHDYFNLSDEIFLKDHKASETFDKLTDKDINGYGNDSAATMNMFVPECNNMAYNYYLRELPHLDDFDAYDVQEGLFKAADLKAPYFQFYVNPKFLDIDYAISQLFTEGPQYMFTYANNVNERLSASAEYRIDTSTLFYIKHKNQNVITVKLEYI